MDFMYCPDCPPKYWVTRRGETKQSYNRLEHLSDCDVDNYSYYSCPECGHAFALVSEIVRRERCEEYDSPSRAEMEAESMKNELANIAKAEAELAARKEKLKKQ
jgi:predicted RNA-binding Zn-ribbon protein involved in translation (DUF1610 family)